MWSLLLLMLVARGLAAAQFRRYTVAGGPTLHHSGGPGPSLHHGGGPTVPLHRSPTTPAHRGFFHHESSGPPEPTTPALPPHGRFFTTPRPNAVKHIRGGGSVRPGFSVLPPHPFHLQGRSPQSDHYKFEHFEHPQPVYQQRPYHHPPPPCDPVAARVDFLPGVNHGLQGALLLRQDCPGGNVIITGTLTGLKPGRHGLHVHQQPNLGANCGDAQGHYNPYDKHHGDQTRGLNGRHVGDLGNIDADYGGVAHVHIIDSIVSLQPGKGNVVGRAMVVHVGEDDLGLGGDEGSAKTGNAGKRAGCGIIAPNNDLCSY